MARILVVEADGVVARDLAQSLRQAGHLPILAADARSALRETHDRPDAVVIDLWLPDLPGEELLFHLRRQPTTALVPVLVMTGRSESAARLTVTAERNVVDILHKPVSGSQLCLALNRALGDQPTPGTHAPYAVWSYQQDLIRRLIVEGPDTLALQVYRRLCADRTRMKSPRSADAMTWTEITEWAKREGLLDAEQAHLLRRVPLAGPEKPGKGAT